MIRYRRFSLFIVLVFLLAACFQTVKSDWNKAVILNTPEAFHEFSIKHPQSEYTKLSKGNEERLRWRNAEQIGTVESFQKFTVDYPRSRFVGTAQTKIEELKWRKAQKYNSIYSYKNYIREHPKGKYSFEAQTRIKELEQKDVAKYQSLQPKHKSLVSIDNTEESDLISMIKSSSEQECKKAAHELSKMGRNLSETQVDSIIDVMRTGKQKWKKSLGRPPGMHCEDYQFTSNKYYAAEALSKMKSPYVDPEIKKEARTTKSKSRWEQRVNDPGWVCF